MEDNPIFHDQNHSTDPTHFSNDDLDLINQIRSVRYDPWEMDIDLLLLLPLVPPHVFSKFYGRPYYIT